MAATLVSVLRKAVVPRLARPLRQSSSGSSSSSTVPPASASGPAAAAAAAAATAAAKRIAVLYHYVPGMLARRGPFRPAHLEHAQKSVADGVMVAGGALGSDAQVGLLVFHGQPEAVRQFVLADPYFAAGLIERWEMHDWNVVVGKL